MFQTPELIITDEIYDLLATTTDCTPLQVPFIHRKFKRDSNEKRIACPGCNPEGSGTKEGEESCPYCKGAGWLWEENIENGWLFRPNIRTAITSYVYPQEVGRDLNKEARLLTLPDVFIHEGDYIYDIKLNKDKRIHIPIKIHEKYLCYFSERYASNQSNSEFNIAGLRV